MASGQSPRGRLHQDVDFVVSDLAGEIVDQVLGIYYVDGDHLSETTTPGTMRHPDCFLLKVRGLPWWHRFFFDAGLFFWGEYDDEDVEEDLESPSIDYARECSLCGLTIVSALCGDRDDRSGTCITIRFGDGRAFVVYPLEPGHLESEVESIVVHSPQRSFV